MRLDWREPRLRSVVHMNGQRGRTRLPVGSPYPPSHALRHVDRRARAGEWVNDDIARFGVEPEQVLDHLRRHRPEVAGVAVARLEVPDVEVLTRFRRFIQNGRFAILNKPRNASLRIADLICNLLLRQAVKPEIPGALLLLALLIRTGFLCPVADRPLTDRQEPGDFFHARPVAISKVAPENPRQASLIAS